MEILYNIQFNQSFNFYLNGCVFFQNDLDLFTEKKKIEFNIIV